MSSLPHPEPHTGQGPARLCALLGTTLPILQAPMAGVQGHALAAAVGQAGALGALPGAMWGPEQLMGELAALRAASPHPVNVNFFCHTPPAPDAERERAWRAVLAPYYAELGVDPAHIASGPGRQPFSAAMADALAPFAPRVVSFHFGLPSADLLARVRAWGAVVISSATTVDEGLWLQAQGVDAVIAQGLEAGGHRGHFLRSDLQGQRPMAELVRALVATLERPVIAAGGITTARDVAAAMALGAAGVQVGSAFLRCPEATTSAVHRQALRVPAAADTALTQLFSGRPARGLVNRLMHELGPMHPAAPAFPLATAATTPLRAAAEALGRGDFSPLWAGTRAHAAPECPAAELVMALAEGLGQGTEAAR